MIDTTKSFYELRIYNRKRGYELTDPKPKDAAEINDRWPDYVEHYGVGIYRSQNKAYLYPIMTYFKSRNLYMEIKEYNRTPRRKSADDSNDGILAITPLGKRNAVTFCKDLFSWHWVVFGTAGMLFWILCQFSLGDIQGVWSFFTVLLVPIGAFAFFVSGGLVIVRIFYICGAYIFQPLRKIWKNHIGKHSAGK